MNKKVIGAWMTAAVVMASFLSRPARAEEEPATPAAASGVVYIIPIKGMIEPALLYVIRRGVAEAQRSNAGAIIFVMDTKGGRLDAATDIVRTIQKISVPTYTFVEKEAFSAGAMIALATDHIYMAPGSVIGDAMPVLMSPTGGPQEMPEALQEKSVSAVAALVRSTAQLKGHDPQLAEKMVRREIEYKIDDEVISPAGQLLTLTNTEAERLVGKEKRRLLSAGTVKDVDELLAVLELSGAQTKELVVTSAERLARYIAALAPFFLMAGMLGLYIEFKTPGFGLPGILGLVSLALFFWGHHIAGLTGMEDIVIFLIGLALVIVEILFLPGFGVIGITGACMMLWALLNAMVQKFPGGPWYPTLPELQIPLFKLASGIVLAGIGAVLAGRYLPQTSVFHSRLVLDEATSRQAGYTASSPTPELVGAEGITDTALHPSGSALFGERRFDVLTRGEYIAPGTRVRIVETQGNRIIVEASGS